MGVEVRLKTGQILTGEYIETYEDRWFYQPPLSKEDFYVLLFELKNQKPYFHFFQLKQVKSVGLASITHLSLKRYLEQRGLILNHEIVEQAHVLTGHEGHHKFEMMFGNFAWDLGRVDARGSQFQHQGDHLEDYYIYGAQVQSPFDATVAAIQSHFPDNLADPTFQSQISDLKPNYVLLLLEYPFYFSIVHFAQDSLTVKAGDKVKKGDILGRVGNSGVSFIPHLHITLFLHLEQWDRFISIPIPSAVY